MANGSDPKTRRARPRPALAIRIPYEGVVQITLEADSHEDELRLRRWLRRSRSLAALPQVLERLLADLDEFDRRKAA